MNITGRNESGRGYGFGEVRHGGRFGSKNEKGKEFRSRRHRRKKRRFKLVDGWMDVLFSNQPDMQQGCGLLLFWEGVRMGGLFWEISRTGHQGRV